MAYHKRALAVIFVLILCAIAPGSSQADPAPESSAPDATLQYGMDLAPVKMGYTPIDQSLNAVKALGFTYAQYYLSWKEIEPHRDIIRWNALTPIIDSAQDRSIKLVFRIYQAPDWAKKGAPANMPAQPIELARFVEALVRVYGTRVPAYVIWNEPNTPAGWEGATVDAAAYVKFLGEAHHAAHLTNPSVQIVSAGLAPTRGGFGAVNDLTYFDQMYHYGLNAATDVVGMNGFGFGDAPDDTSDPSGLNFTRLAALRGVMEAHGGGAKPVWALEVGWVAKVPQTLPGFDAYKVPELLQALYLRRAMDKARIEWPWLSVMFLWNLDFGPDKDEPEKAAFAIRNRPAYQCVRLVAPVCPCRTFLPLVLRS